MKTVAFFALLVASTTALARSGHLPVDSSSQNAWKLQPVTASQKLTALQNGVLEPFQAVPVQLEAARGEWENFQFVVTAADQPIEKLEITPNGLASMSGDFLSSQNFALYRENYVYVAHPSGNAVLTPKWWPDALVPLDLASQSIAAGQSAVFWATLYIPAATPPGDYYGEIDFKADGAPRRLAVTVTVPSAALPAPSFRGTVALYYDTLRDWYRKNGQNFSDSEWDAQKKRYYDFLLDYGINAYDLPVAWNSSEVENYLSNPRVLSVRTPPLDSPDFPLALQKFKATNTLKKAFYYWIDEPQTPADFARVRETTQKLRKLGIAHLVTAHPNAALKDAVDIWCPNIGDFFGIGHLDLKTLAAERQKGHPIWLYTMVEPKHPYPTWLLDDEAKAIRDYATIWQRVGANGFVYSMCHGWGPKPLENLESFAGTNGDGTLLYPAELVGGVGPMPSIRLMLLRDAIEDYELKRTHSTPLFLDTPTPCSSPASGSSILDEGREKQPEYPLTTAMWMRQNGFLTVKFEAQMPADKEFVAVELAPHDAGEKWRFVLTIKGNKVVERRTRDGAFRLPDFDFEGATRFDPHISTSFSIQKYFLKIPLREIPWAKNGVRFNLLRQTQIAAQGTHVTQHLPHSSDDPFTWPLLTVAK